MQELAQSVHSLLNIRLSAKQLSDLHIYERELLEWNTRFNLTAIDNPETIHTKHFLDSLTCVVAMQDTPIGRVLDLGTGAGFPGLPLKILYPKMRLTLVDSVGKKVEFCRHIVKVLQLEGVDVIQDRAESLGHQAIHREQYDWSIARAVAIMPVLMEYLLPFVKVGGKALAMKGQDAHAEAHTADHAIRILGGHLQRLVPITLPGVADERHLIVVDKVAATPKKYPRRTGAPAKKPL
jgi:16S rRNA (guanine527-N7)-methyltransferase